MHKFCACFSLFLQVLLPISVFLCMQWLSGGLWASCLEKLEYWEILLNNNTIKYHRIEPKKNQYMGTNNPGQNHLFGQLSHIKECHTNLQGDSYWLMKCLSFILGQEYKLLVGKEVQPQKWRQPQKRRRQNQKWKGPQKWGQP